MSNPHSRDVFEQTLERVRRWYGFFVTGYVTTPEHIHLLVSEPELSALARALHLLKQNTAHLLHPPEGSPFWLPRYYDFNVRSEDKPSRETTLHASEPCEARLGGAPGRLVVE